jgi:hypothetical protein
MTGRRYTWANNLPCPTYEMLDRILVATEWEHKYPLSTVIVLNRDLSDHTPLLLNTWESNSCNHTSRFKFELGWLLREDFFDMVANIWSSVTEESSPMERWQAKIHRLRQHLRGWSKHTSGVNKKQKHEIIGKLDEIDKKAEVSNLLPHELDLKHFLQNKLAQMLREEELKWYQRAKTQNFMQGDSNTRYFHLVF